MFESIRDAVSRWRPGFPSTGPTFALWAVDPDPDGHDLGEHAFVFLVDEGGGQAYLLANRTGEHVELETGIHVRQVKKFKTQLGGRSIPVRSCALLDPGDDRGTALPGDVTGDVLPPRQFTTDDVDELDELL